MSNRTRIRNSWLVVLATLALGCSGSSDGTVDDTQGGSPAGVSDGGAGSGSGNGGSGGHADGGGGGTGGGPGGGPGGGGVDAGGNGGGGADASTHDSGGGNGGGGDSGGVGNVPVPTPVGACPTFQNGTVTFNPAAGARTVQLYLDPSTLQKHGPLVIYWYATYGSPSQAQQALGSSLTQIESLGGIVAAPQDNGTGQFPWLDNVSGNMLLADEIVGCAAKAGIDTRRIHTLGFSAGALMATTMSFGRSSYVASVATYSGGLTSSNAPPYQNANNKFAALILTGGTSDNVFNTDFQAASQAYQSKLKADGHSALYCNHGGGHTIPQGYPAAVGQFLLDHPFGTNPSPYVGNLPPALKACTF